MIRGIVIIGLSTLCSLFTLASGVSYWHGVSISFNDLDLTSQNYTGISVRTGRVSLGVRRIDDRPNPVPKINIRPAYPPPPWSVVGFLGIEYRDMPVIFEPPSNGQGVAKAYRYRGVSLPAWLVILITGAYPVVAFIRGPFRRWRHRKRGHCVTCGYDLTGNVTGVCSECGTKAGPALTERSEQP